MSGGVESCGAMAPDQSRVWRMVDNGRPGRAPTRFLAHHHGAPRPQWHRRSRWDEIDSRGRGRLARPGPEKRTNAPPDRRPRLRMPTRCSWHSRLVGPGCSRHGCVHVGAKLRGRYRPCRRSAAHEVDPCMEAIGIGHFVKNPMKSPPNSVSDDGIPHTLTDGVRHAGPRAIVRQPSNTAMLAVVRFRGPKPRKVRTVVYATDQADSFARPRRRRALRTARPPLVDMRLRKPWRLARLRTFG